MNEGGLRAEEIPFGVSAVCRIVIFSLWGVISLNAYAGVGINIPSPSISVYAFPDTSKGLSFTQIEAPALFIPKNEYLKYKFTVDSSRTTMIGEPGIADPYFAPPVVFSLEDYKQFRFRKDVRAQFRASAAAKVTQTRSETGDGALKIEIPWRVKSKTFRKIFGGDRVGLRVSGQITINGGLRRQKTDQNLTTQNDQANYSFRIDQTQRFTIEGKVGDKVSVMVDQDSERLFDFENAIKLEYTGEEDEIIQKIEAGNVTLGLTGTKLATFSGKNTGLFGLKTQSRLGPLKLTTIASVQKGQKNKKSLTGGAEETTMTIQSINPMRGKYFFLDESFRENYRYFSQSMDHVVTSGIDPLQDIEVYKTVYLNASTATQGLREGWAMYTPGPVPQDSTEDNNNVRGFFKQLVKNSDYTYDSQLGYLRLNYALNDDEALACAYVTQNGQTIGNYVLPPPGDSTLIVLKLLRPPNPQPSDSAWNLEFKNVYYLGASNIQKEGFELKVFKKSLASGSDSETQEVEGQQQTYLEILGLDRRNDSGGNQPDGKLDDNPWFINYGTGELFLPGLRPFDPDPGKPDAGYFVAGDLIITSLDSVTWNPMIYDTTKSYTPTSYYYISVKHKSASASYNLGFNVLEGSEEVYLNGQQLKKGTDYNIDYLTGNLVILNQAASSASANVEVLWESGEIFQLDKKTLLGVRGEYELWNDQSFIGTTALYLNEKPLEERVKVGNEPTRNFILDANSRMVFESEFLTNLLDWMPLIEAEAPSEITVDGEIARVYPNPNSLNNEATGDYNGVAYVDDFESIKRTTSLGIMRRNWKLGSIPSGAVAFSIPDSLKNLTRGRIYWFNPYDQVPIKQIWPNRETNSLVASEVHVLGLGFQPSADSLGLTNQDTEDSWGSIQRYLSAGYADQSKAKYLEVWVKTTGASNVEVNIDLGKVSEDVIPNSKLNTEDKPLENQQFGDGILDDDEDVGLDMMGNNDSRAATAGGDFWDINSDSLKQPWEPYSFDGYSYSPSAKNNYSQINGTEGNRIDEGERIPDTEDLNSNGTLDQIEKFYRCSFTLPPPDSLLVGEINEYGWMQIQFPLKYAQRFNNANWTEIEYTRIWVTGVSDSTALQFASVELVGNEWEEVVDTTIAGTPQERLEINTLNTYDNGEVYEPPPGVRGERDPVTNLLAREQSLRIQVVDLPPHGIAMVQRTFYNTMNFLEYDSLKMFVRGGGQYNFNPDIYELNSFFRFGADTSSNYYEFYQKLKPGWADDNNILVSLEEIPTLKLDRDALNSGLIDTTQTLTRVDPEDSTVAYRIIEGDSMVVKGNPSLSQIRQLTIGIHNPTKDHYRTEDELEVWVDELRLSSVKKDPGTAYRTSADIKLSDLGNIHLEMTEQDADFHSLEQRLGSQTNKSNQAVSGSFSLDRLLPPTWGLQLPLTGNYSNDISTPKYYPNSDILLDKNDQAAVDTVRTLNERKGWSIDFSRRKKSAHPLLKYTLDNISTGYDYSDSYGTSPTNEYTKTKSHSMDLSYGLSFPRDVALGFMGWAKGIPLLKKLKDTRFAFLPTQVRMSLSGTETRSETLTRSQSFTQSRIFGFTRVFTTGLRPFNVMSFDFSRTHRSDMQERGWSDAFRGDFGRDNNITQNFNTNYAPEIFKWLTHDVNYSSNYQWTWGSGFSQSGQNISNNSSIATSWTLKMSQLFPKKSTGQRGRGSTSGRGGAKPKEEEEKKKAEEEKKKIDFLSPLKFVTSRINDIRFDYTHSKNLSMAAVEGQAGWEYQLGLSEDPGVGRIAGYNTSVPAKSITDDYKVKSGVDLISNLKTTFDYSLNNTQNFGINNSGQYTETQFYTFTDKGKINSFPFINLSMRLTGLEKLSFFQNVAQTVSLESAFTGKAKTDWTTNKSNITNQSYDRNLSPLLGINITWQGGISTNLQYKKTQSLTDKITLGTKNKTDNTTVSLTANYTRRSGFRIPIPVWPFNNKRFKNNTTFSLTFSSSVRTEATLTGDAEKFSATNEIKQWSVKPKVDYTFSNTVTGGVFFETGLTDNKLTGKTSFHEFGFNVNIQIRGR